MHNEVGNMDLNINLRSIHRLLQETHAILAQKGLFQ